MIKLVDVVKEYQIDGEPFFALNHVNLEIKDGEYTAILGPSGSGKSTIMHIMGLLDTPTSGKVFIDNIDVTTYSDNELSKTRSTFVGFVFQQFNLINKLTVKENILLPTIYARQKFSYNPVAYAEALISQFGLQGKEHSYPNKISGGQQQRVAIARALVMKPQLLLADEPTGNLDTKNGDTILDLIGELNTKQKVTVVLITHEPDVAKRTRRQVYIRDGHLFTKLSQIKK